MSHIFFNISATISTISFLFSSQGKHMNKSINTYAMGNLKHIDIKNETEWVKAYKIIASVKMVHTWKIQNML